MKHDSSRSSALAVSRAPVAMADAPPIDDLLGKLYEHVLNGVCCSQIIYQDGKAVDRLYLYTNPAFRSQTGMPDVAGRLASEVHKGLEAEEQELLAKLANVASTGKSEVFEHCERSTGQWFAISAYCPQPGIVVKVFDNITERKRMEQERDGYQQKLEKRLADQMQALRESEERYRGLFESLPVGIVAQASNGEITEANQAACDILRLSMDQFCGMTSLDPTWKPFHQDGSPFPGEEHPAMRALATGKPQMGVIMGLGEGGDRTWISINSHPLFHKGQERPYEALSSFVDITKRLRHEELLHTIKSSYEDLLAAATECAIIGTDLDGTITLFNRGAELMLGYSEKEVVGRLTPKVFHPPGQMETAGTELAHKVGSGLDGFQAVLATVRKDGRFHRDWTYVRKDGSSFRAAVCITPIRTARGELTGQLAVLQDITERVRLEEVLQRSLQAALPNGDPDAEHGKRLPRTSARASKRTRSRARR